MATRASSNQTQILTIHGDLQSGSFRPWVVRYCQRLGLQCEMLHADRKSVMFRVNGQIDLIDALEVGCMLGPYDVWVETIDRDAAPSEV